MADVKQIGGYEAMILSVGYIFSGEVAHRDVASRCGA